MISEIGRRGEAFWGLKRKKQHRVSEFFFAYPLRNFKTCITSVTGHRSRVTLSTLASLISFICFHMNREPYPPTGTPSCAHAAIVLRAAHRMSAEPKSYGGHSAHLILHIIISEFQYIILDSSLKILSGCEKYLIFIGRVCLFCAFIYSIRLCSTFRHSSSMHQQNC